MEDHQPTSAEPVTLEVSEGRKVSLAPITVGQARRALMLDPNEGHTESHRENVLRMCAQAKVLFGPAHGYLSGKLQPAQGAEVNRALYLAAWGKPYEATLWEPGFLYVYPKLGGVADLGKVDALAIELSIVAGKSDAEIDAMPLSEALALSATLPADDPAGSQPGGRA